MELRVMFLLFIIYSFLGWLMEFILVSAKNKKITDRGFLIGPYCPIYGTGALLMTTFLTKYTDDLIALFVMCCLFGAILEYFTSYIMEKLFKTRWWDYSDHKYNINGRICLDTTVAFGALGLVLIHFLNPFFENLINIMPNIVQLILAVILGIIFTADLITSFNIISNIKRIDLSEAKDTTEEITAIVKERLKNKSLLHKRLVLAFPNLKIKIQKDLKKLENITRKK